MFSLICRNIVFTPKVFGAMSSNLEQILEELLMVIKWRTHLKNGKEHRNQKMSKGSLGRVIMDCLEHCVKFAQIQH